MQIKQKTVQNTYHDVTTGRSIWGGYGTDPYDEMAMELVYREEGLNERQRLTMEKGIYLKVEETLHETRTTQPTVSENVDLSNDLGTRAYNMRVSPTSEVSPHITTGSMISDLQLFEEQSLQVGKIASSKLISEAIAIIPYFEKAQWAKPRGEIRSSDDAAEKTSTNSKELYRTREIIPGRHFLPINKSVFENVLATILTHKFYSSTDAGFSDLWGSDEASLKTALATDCGKMIDTLIGNSDSNGAGYQLPPEFDFIHNAAVEPFQIMLIPFSHELGKQDLINIYQGIMPDISIRLEKELNSIEVQPLIEIDDPLITPSNLSYIDRTGKSVTGGSFRGFNFANFLSPQIFINDGRLSAFSDSKGTADFPDWNSKDFYGNLKFMTFKVKQRAKKDFKSYKERQVAFAARSKFIDPSLAAGTGGQNFTLTSRFEEYIHNIKSSEVYGTNWPYDYFSLIEAIKLDIEFEVVK